MSKEQHPEIFADELSGMMLGYPVSKLTFSAAKQSGNDGAVEKNNVLTLTLSTHNLLSACKLILNNASDNQDLILSGASTSEEKLLALLQSEEPSTLTAMPVKKKPKVVKESMKD